MIMKSFFSCFWSFVLFARFPLLVLAFFWLFTVNVYAGCTTIGSPYYYYESLTKSNRCYSSGANTCNPKCSASLCGEMAALDTIVQSGNYFYTNYTIWSDNRSFCDFNATSGVGCSDLRINSVIYRPRTECTTREDACELSPNSEGCADVCAVYRQQCEQLGGVFFGRGVVGGCAGSCNTCGAEASKIILEIKQESCCSQGLAPLIDKMCFTPDLGDDHPGLQVSTNADLECVDPNLDDENMSLYVQYCSDNPPGSSSSQQTTSSSGGGGSSGSEGDSSSSEESGNSSGSNIPGLENDYYPILDTIRDSLLNIRRNVEKIYTCLITPGTCGGMNPKISIPSDSNFLKNINSTINTTNTLLDSSLRNGNDRLRNSIASANDTLIDSLRKFLGGSSAGFSGDTLGDSLGRIHRTLEDFKAMFEAGEIDTTGFGAEYGGYIARGEQLKDSIIGALGWADIDTINIDSLYSRALNGSKIDSVSGAVDDSLGLMAGKLGDSLSRKTDSLKKALPGVLDSLADSLVIWAPFADFDSIIYSTIGAHVPNRADCPEDCQKWTVSIPIIGLHSYTVDFGLCLGRASFGGMSVLALVKLLIRLVVAYICIMTAYKVLVRMI